MTFSIPNTGSWFFRNWFWPIALLIAVGDLSSIYFVGWSDTQLLEAAILFDFVVVIPLLYWWCYRHTGKAAVIRSVVLACFALWATAKVIPAEHRHLLDSVSWLRYVGLAGLLILEIKLAVMVYKAVVFFGQSKDQAQATFESEGMPAWLAKIMAFEASLWRKGWLFLRRVFGRNNQGE